MLNKLQKKPTFFQKGLKGFQYPIKNKNFEIYLVDVRLGHDNYIISRKITHVYCVLRGKGVFEINRKKITVKSGDLIEVPPKVEYVYSGKMKLLLIMNPPWFKGNEKITKKNLKVK